MIKIILFKVENKILKTEMSETHSCLKEKSLDSQEFFRDSVKGSRMNFKE